MIEFDILIDDAEKEVFHGKEKRRKMLENANLQIENISGCTNQIQDVQKTWETRFSEKDVLVVKFEEILTEDIKQLFEEVTSIQEDVNKDWLIDETSNIAQVKEFLVNLSDRLSVCVSQMEEYRNYQKEFKVSQLDRL